MWFHPNGPGKNHVCEISGSRSAPHLSYAPGKMCCSEDEPDKPRTAKHHDAQVEFHRSNAISAQLLPRVNRKCLALPYGHRRTSGRNIPLEGAAQFGVVRGFEKSVLNCRMAPRTGIHRRISSLHKRNQRQLFVLSRTHDGIIRYLIHYANEAPQQSERRRWVTGSQ
jgi:hypothetical protein